MSSAVSPGAVTPTFAVLGAVNHGKSSVASTLAENDQVRISPIPGETVECQRFTLGDLFVFFDTPGFQNAREALAELRDAAGSSNPLDVFRAFVERHRGEPEFDAECRLFGPVVDGAGIIYVVDGSRPLLDIHLAEMELLRLTGAARMAVINRTSADDHVDEWRRRLGQHFNAVREFDAMAATFADRIELLETLAGIEQRWKPRLMEAVRMLREQWRARLDDAAEIVVGLLVDMLQLEETAPANSARAEQELAETLKQRYVEAAVRCEARAHRVLIELFAHRLVRAGEMPPSLVADGLFAEATWSLLGLNTRQLITAGAVAGAAVGAGADALTVGHTLLAGTALGAALGAAGALALGKRRPELALQLPLKQLPEALRALMPEGIRLGGGVLRVGPNSAVNFPWILLDRALGTLAYVTRRAHARRDRVTLEAAQIQALLSEFGVASTVWPEQDRKTCERAFAAIRRHRLTDAQRGQLKEAVRLQIVRAAGQALEEFRALN